MRGARGFARSDKAVFPPEATRRRPREVRRKPPESPALNPGLARRLPSCLGPCGRVKRGVGGWGGGDTARQVGVRHAFSLNPAEHNRTLCRRQQGWRSRMEEPVRSRAKHDDRISDNLT
jgi:hypothetical protein